MISSLDFPIISPGIYSSLFLAEGCSTFSQACSWIHALPYGRNSIREDFTLVFSEKRGTCSSKHAVLAFLALEQEHPEVELISGIFMMNGETHSVLAGFFDQRPYTVIPECHCYLRINGQRFDYTALNSSMDLIEPKIVREQRMDPHQAIEWKVNIHKNYIEGWLRRNPQIALTPDEIWEDREECIALLES